MNPRLRRDTQFSGRGRDREYSAPPGNLRSIAINIKTTPVRKYFGIRQKILFFFQMQANLRNRQARDIEDLNHVLGDIVGTK